MKRAHDFLPVPALVRLGRVDPLELAHAVELLDGASLAVDPSRVEHGSHDVRDRRRKREAGALGVLEARVGVHRLVMGEHALERAKEAWPVRGVAPFGEDTLLAAVGKGADEERGRPLEPGQVVVGCCVVCRVVRELVVVDLGVRRGDEDRLDGVDPALADVGDDVAFDLVELGLPDGGVELGVVGLPVAPGVREVDELAEGWEAGGVFGRFGVVLVLERGELEAKGVLATLDDPATFTGDALRLVCLEDLEDALGDLLPSWSGPKT